MIFNFFLFNRAGDCLYFQVCVHACMGQWGSTPSVCRGKLCCCLRCTSIFLLLLVGRPSLHPCFLCCCFRRTLLSSVRGCGGCGGCCGGSRGRAGANEPSRSPNAVEAASLLPCCPAALLLVALQWHFAAHGHGCTPCIVAGQCRVYPVSPVSITIPRPVCWRLRVVSVPLAAC